MSKARETVETLRTVLVDGDVTNANFTGADLEVGKGGTGASSAGAARTALGVAIGTDVLAPDGDGSALTGVDSLPSQTSQTGKFLTTNGSAASWGEAGGGITLATPLNLSSGTTVTIAGIPSGTKRITIMFYNVGLTGSSSADSLWMRIGDSGGIETSGYRSGVFNAAGSALSTYYFPLEMEGNYDTLTYDGTVVLTLENSTSFNWTTMGVILGSATTDTQASTGRKSLSSELTQIQFGTLEGNKNFASGQINISYE